MSETAHKHQSRKLACPHCGGKLLVSMDIEGRGHMSYDVLSGFMCTTLNCGAEWDVDGEPSHEPNWVLWPSIYTKSEKEGEADASE